MSRTVVKGLLGVLVGIGVYYRFGGEITLNAILAILTSSAGAFVVLARQRRLVRFAVGVLAAGGAVSWALAVHDDLRAERQDTGPDPTVLKADPRVASISEAWTLPTDDGSLRVRATGLGPRVDLAPAAKDTAIEWRNAPPQLPKRDAPTTRPWRFAVWADCRGGAGAFEEVREGIASRDVAFSVGVGDLVGMARTYQFEILALQMTGTRAPAFFVPGNHDVDPFGTLRPFARALGPSHWCFVVDHILFVGLDSARGEELLDDDATWAEGVVRGRAKDVTQVVVFVHNPIYPPAGHPTKTLVQDKPATSRIRALVEESKAWCFSGDFHGFDRSTHGEHGGVVQIVSGGAGGRLEDEGPHHWILVTVTPEGLRADRVDVVSPSDVRPWLDRVRVFRDETAWVAHTQPLKFVLGWLLAAFGLGGVFGSLLPRRGA